MNYFKLFGFIVNYKIDEKILKNRYKELQKKYHPDRHFNKTNLEKKETSDISSMINIAYRTLKNPVERIEHILDINHSYNKEINIIQDKRFLKKQFSYYEKLEYFKKNKTSKEEINIFIQFIKYKIEYYFKKIEESLSKKNFSKASNFFYKLKFLIKIKKEIDKIN
ncbi:MAG: Fe-S protein assembly co-chaperone HscB [Arsenophonus sp.]|nr:MAG: Fe-S protein assembly co-chaperone HscB [Arsenophonus sp.]